MENKLETIKPDLVSIESNRREAITYAAFALATIGSVGFCLSTLDYEERFNIDDLFRQGPEKFIGKEVNFFGKIEFLHSDNVEGRDLGAKMGLKIPNGANSEIYKFSGGYSWEYTLPAIKDPQLSSGSSSISSRSSNEKAIMSGRSMLCEVHGIIRENNGVVYLGFDEIVEYVPSIGGPIR